VLGVTDNLWLWCTVYYTVCFSFIRLADYLIVNMMHMLAVNSITTMLTAFSTQLQMTPPVEAIQAWTSVLNEIPEVPELGDNVSSSSPLFDILENPEFRTLLHYFTTVSLIFTHVDNSHVIKAFIRVCDSVCLSV